MARVLTVISGNIERLLGSGIGDGNARIEAALAATMRGDALIRKMLTFARRHVRDPELVEISAALTSFEPLLGSALNRNIVVEYHPSPEPMACRIDPAEFDFAVLNIVTNAGHAMPNGGRLKIMTSTEFVTAQNALELDFGEYAKIAISDSGQGMPPDVLAHAFELFFTTRKHGVGTGLGLSQVYGFAKQSGGVATIDSAVGCGTTVTMYLPLVETKALSESASSMMACGPRSGDQNIRYQQRPLRCSRLAARIASDLADAPRCGNCASIFARHGHTRVGEPTSERSH